MTTQPQPEKSLQQHLNDHDDFCNRERETDYDTWAEDEGLAELDEWSDLLDSDEEFYLDGDADVMDLADCDDSIACDD